MSKLCETGEQGGLTVGVRFVIMQQCRTLSDVTVESIDHLMNSRNEKATFICCDYRSLVESSYLVDPASSHMLVSKIKPCMSKYKQICTVKLRMAH